MNKKQFIYYFNQVTLDESLESQIKILEKIRDVWIPEIIKRKEQNYTYCQNCRKYIRTKSFNVIHKKEWITDVCVSRDAGYGDGDIYADVLYDITYSVCPNCGFEKILSKTGIETKNEHERN